MIFLRKSKVFYTDAIWTLHCGKHNSAPAEDLHNKNPSLALSGKKLE